MLFDQCMTLEKKNSRVCQSSYKHFRRIAKIRRLLSMKAVEQLIHAFITSKLDFCKSLLAGLPQSTLQRLQSVENPAARLLTGNKMHDYITPILYNLHWLPINQRLKFKIVILTLKALQGLAPLYIQNLLTPHTTRPGLRFTSNILLVPRSRLASYWDRFFSFTAPRLWNSLPENLREIHNISIFSSNSRHTCSHFLSKDCTTYHDALSILNSKKTTL